MREIKDLRDLENRLDLLEMRREIELDKMKQGFRGLKGSIVPQVLLLPLLFAWRKWKRKKKD